MTKHTICVILPLLILMLGFQGCSNSKQNADKSPESFTFAFLTDIHVQHEKRADEGFQKAIDHVNNVAPDFIVTGGDLIMDALAQPEDKAMELYDLYLDLEKGFKMPVYNTLGNHEEFGFFESSGIDPSHALYGDKMYESKIGKRFYSFEEKGWKFYILDSVEETEKRKYYGFVDKEQIEWIKNDLLNVDPETPVAIVTHIPLITAVSQYRSGSLTQNPESLVIGNSKEVLDLFSEHNLKLVLQGHLHIVEDVYIGGIHFITGGAVCAKWWDGPIGEMEEGYVLIHVNGDDFDWEYVDYGWDI